MKCLIPRIGIPIPKMALMTLKLLYFLFLAHTETFQVNTGTSWTKKGPLRLKEGPFKLMKGLKEGHFRSKDPKEGAYQALCLHLRGIK